MASSAIPAADLQSFSTYLKGCKRIVALLGAGISAASGLPTFRGAGGFWRTYDAVDLATPEAFEAHPDLVWQFYGFRRHMALKAQPNAAHYALADLARRNKEFMTLTQNVDGLSQRADHPPRQLQLLHGSLFTIKCTSFYCNYVSENDFTDPVVPALAIPQNKPEPTPSTGDKTGAEATRSLGNAMSAGEGEDLDMSDTRVPLPSLSPDVLPHCPQCKTGLLRPGVVWFGEPLPRASLDAVDDFLDAGPIDLILVIGTSSRVYPAAGYIDIARSKGARVAVVNMDSSDVGASGLQQGDWLFQGDAGVIVPEILGLNESKQ